MAMQHLTPPEFGPWAWLLRGVLPAVGTALLVVYTGARRAERLGRALDEERWERGQQRRRRRGRGGTGPGPVGAGAGAGADAKVSFLFFLSVLGGWCGSSSNSYI